MTFEDDIAQLNEFYFYREFTYSINKFKKSANDEVEFADNVITVGAMTRHYDERLVASFSNYGKKNVDVFAPGLEIYSTFPKDSSRRSSSS